MALYFYKKQFVVKWWAKMESWIWRTSFLSNGKSNSCGVAIGYCGIEDLKVVNTAYEKNGRILILDAELNGTNFLLINFYNSNIESEQLSTFSTLQKLL